jgi:hypothetical protein
LQLEFRRIDAARHVGGEDKKQVDFLGSTCDRRPNQDRGRDNKYQQASSGAHADLRMQPCQLIPFFPVANDSVIVRWQRVARSIEAPQTAIATYDFAIQQTVMLTGHVSYWPEAESPALVSQVR